MAGEEQPELVAQEGEEPRFAAEEEKALVGTNVKSDSRQLLRIDMM